jgi:hypothetical protein
MTTWLILGCGFALVALLLYPRFYPWLFGAYYCTGWFGRMPFWTQRAAERYRAGSGDPYRRGLQGPIVFAPGVLCRRSDRSAPTARGADHVGDDLATGWELRHRAT